jgi:hypothetical protein
VLPYIAEENHDEDPEVLVKPDQDDATARALKAAIHDQRSQVRGHQVSRCLWRCVSACDLCTCSDCQDSVQQSGSVESSKTLRDDDLQTIYPKVRQFVEEFHAGKPAGHIDAPPAAKPVVTDHSANVGSASKATAGKKASTRSTAQNGMTRGSQQIVLKETFYASAPVFPSLDVGMLFAPLSHGRLSCRNERGQSCGFHAGPLPPLRRTPMSALGSTHDLGSHPAWAMITCGLQTLRPVARWKEQSRDGCRCTGPV